ncbi:hypothetical protein [Paramicrobacterium chengjingii]|uniref:hypothetical protein n=1 Tax=Paramicrobacterium chengjingii TaxID=2769067 RepID=UPI0014216DFE|nr:hypothetical protein [Microbacterium chengjingii]
MSSPQSNRSVIRRIGNVLSRVSGYGLSVAALAVAALAAIPAMIHADGAQAWAAIAVGQSIGGIAAVVIGYGWGMTGPARIAAAQPRGQRSEYVESLRVKLCIALPASAVAAACAVFLVPVYAVHAAIGALAMSSVGLSANWFFTGVRRPYLQLVAETAPRVAGTGIGIALMYSGASAVVGMACQLGGMLLGFAIATSWVLSAFPRGGSTRQLRLVLSSQGTGLASTVLSAAYIAAPVAIVTQVAPGALPVFALIDKVQRQISVGLGPVIVVAQAWVPRARGFSGLRQRVKQCVIGALSVGTLLGVITVIAAPFLMDWLSGGVIEVPLAALLLAGAFVAVGFIESTVSKAIMPAIDRVGVAAKAASISMIVGLPLVALGAVALGVIGALSGVVFGLVVRVAIELASSGRRFSFPRESDLVQASSLGGQRA